MALDKRNWQGNYGEALIGAMAGAAGLVATRRSLDADGIDLTILHPGRLAGRRHAAIDVQVKSWSSAREVGGAYAFPLARANYDNLVGVIGEDFPVARLLLLVVVPPDQDDYMLVEESCISLRHCVYWLDLMGEPPLAEDENMSSRTVYVPRSNRVDATILRSLLARDFAGEQR